MNDHTVLSGSAEQADTEASFDWRACWYPVSFLEDLPRDGPTAVSLYDTGLVLFFDGDGELHCLRDLCPHRAARLSDGQIVDGRLECLYHGWQFDGAGDCQFIPQMLPDKDYPIRSCVRRYPLAVRDGIVWIWAGDVDAADPARIPRSPGAGGEDVHEVTFQMDLPYDQSYLIENVIDVAHIHIAHDGVRGGGLREAAKPLQFDVAHSGPDGIRATFRSIGLERGDGDAKIAGAQVEFVAPNLIRYASNYADPELVAGLDLYSLPIGKGRCRLLYRKYSNFTGWRERIKPRWLEHQTQCLILEQDMNVVVGQHEEIERAGKRLRDLWLPIKTSDKLVVEYRKWLDRHGSGLPFFRGFERAQNSGIDPEEARQPHDRRSLHTAICATCQRVARRIDQGIKLAAVVAVLAFSLAILVPGTAAKATLVGVALVAVSTIAALRNLRQRI
mgnify:CR=1 FL=1